MKRNIVIVEDEHMAASRLKQMVENLDSSYNVVEVFPSIDSASKYLENKTMPDLILMDIQLADGISFEIFDIVNITCPVIFTTAYDEFAIQAFKVHAIDYLLKPIKKNELEKSIHRALETNAVVHDKILELAYPGKSEKVLVKLGQQLIVLTLNEAHYYFTENKMSFFVDSEAKRYPVDHSLDRLEELLDMNQFFRVNRQFIINRQFIESMSTYSVNRIKVKMKPKSTEDIIVSKDRVSHFRKWLLD